MRPSPARRRSRFAVISSTLNFLQEMFDAPTAGEADTGLGRSRGDHRHRVCGPGRYLRLTGLAPRDPLLVALGKAEGGGIWWMRPCGALEIQRPIRT
jgi:hypothetical protein